MVIFKDKPRKAGRSSWYILIPGDYVKNGLVNPKKELIVEIKEGDASVGSRK